MSNCKTPLLYPLVQHPSMEGFVAKQDMPIYLSLLFRARRPLEPLKALHTPKYGNRPLEPLIDQHHAIGVH